MVLLLLSWSGGEPVAVFERVDRIELNHFYDENAVHVFSQRIFWTWDRQACRYQVKAWRLVKPEQNHYLTGNTLCFTDDKKIIRKIVATSVFESWSQVDIELLERSTLPKEMRLELLPYASRKRAGELTVKRRHDQDADPQERQHSAHWRDDVLTDQP